jgi:hypothetical protein
MIIARRDFAKKLEPIPLKSTRTYDLESPGTTLIKIVSRACRGLECAVMFHNAEIDHDYVAQPGAYAPSALTTKHLLGAIHHRLRLLASIAVYEPKMLRSHAGGLSLANHVRLQNRSEALGEALSKIS